MARYNMRRRLLISNFSRRRRRQEVQAKAEVSQESHLLVNPRAVGRFYDVDLHVRGREDRLLA